MNLAHTLLRTAARLPDASGVEERGHARYTYAQLAQRTLRLAAALRGRLGYAPGKRVALAMKNNAAYVELLYSCWAAGLAAVPINVKLHPRELAFIFDDAQVAVCFVTDEVDTSAIEAARGSGRTEYFDIDRPEYAALIGADPAAPHDGAADDPAWLFYTSGTTGRPKGVLLTHRNLLAMALNYLADVDHAVAADVLLHAAPMSHGSGLYTIPNVMAGAAQLIAASRGFDVDEIDAILAHTHNVKFFAAPTMAMRLVDGLRGDARGLKLVVYVGGPQCTSPTASARWRAWGRGWHRFTARAKAR